MLALASFAALATSPAPPVLSVQRLVVAGDILYTKPTGGYMVPDQTKPPGTASRDAGQSWFPVDALPQAAADALDQTSTLPATACLPDAPLTCYRVDGRPLVEETRDGGQTWQIAWRIAPGRVEYAQRDTFLPFANPAEPEMQTYDLVLAPRNGQWTPVAAMGNQGVVSLIDGEWLRLPVTQTGYQPAKPTPLKASDLGEGLFKVFVETFLLLAAGLLVYLGTSIYGWVLAGRHLPEGVPAPRPIFKTLRFLGLWLLASVILYFLGSLIHHPLNALLYYPAAIGFALFPLVWIIVIAVNWGSMARAARQPDTQRAAKIAFFTGLAVFLLPTLAFLLWTMAVIPFYTLAASIAIAAGVACLAAGVIFIRRKLR
jgi:hypothetical protein